MRQQQSSFIWILIVIVFIFIAYLFVNDNGSQQKGRNGGNQTNVKTVQVSYADWQRQIKTLGTALAYESANIVSASSDYLTILKIEEGQPIQKGTLIAQLNDAEEQARVNELNALLQEQTRQLTRLKNLTRTQATAQSLFDEQQAKVNATQAQLQALQARLTEMRIYAPFDGVLGLRKVSEGAFISAGTVLTTLDDISKLKVEFNVAERYMADLQVGMSLDITHIAYKDAKFSGVIQAIDPRIDPVTRSIKVHGVIENADLKLRPGMLLAVQVSLAQTRVLIIPEKALVPLQNRQFLFVVNPDDTVKQVEVTIGERRPGWVEVTTGLTENAEIVVEGSQKLRSGAKITRTEQ